MAKVIVRHEPAAIPDSLPAELPPVLKRIYAARGVVRAEELENAFDHLIPPQRLKGIDEASALLETALRERWRILIVGDFDADGATSSALSVRALRMLGAADVRFLVPNRFEYGYGLTPEIVAVAAQQSPDLIMTVDNGISSIQGVAAAKALGIRVLVTDHHLPAEQLPDADAIVNPNQPGDDFPSKSLAGVGVAFYVMLALRARLRSSGWFTEQGIEEPNLAELLDIVALGTVADVVPLDHNNRILVAQGLKRIRAGRAVPGILVLLEVAGRQYQRVVASDMGFAIGPRLNAAGRLEDMSIGIECLLADDATVARGIAAQLDQLNRERREIETGMKEEAMAELDALHLDDGTDMPTGVCLYKPDWHQGVIGILASRVKEAWHRPVIVFAKAGENELKGSARSVPGLHIRDALDAIAARHPDLIQKFGGHAMAAGLSIAESDYPAFAAAFDAEARLHLSDDALHGVLASDGELSEQEFALEVAQQLRDAGPWGQAFPEPMFDNRFEFVNGRIVGEKHLKMTVQPVGGGISIDAIAFFQSEHLAYLGQTVHLAYRLDVNEFRGQRNLQLIVEHIEPVN